MSTELEANFYRHFSTPIAGCAAYTRLLPTGQVENPRWTITYKESKSDGRHGGYGRMHEAQVVSTVSRGRAGVLFLLCPFQEVVGEEGTAARTRRRWAAQ